VVALDLKGSVGANSAFRPSAIFGQPSQIGHSHAQYSAQVRLAASLIATPFNRQIQLGSYWAIMLPGVVAEAAVMELKMRIGSAACWSELLKFAKISIS
jgi:hypothetical protein